MKEVFAPKKLGNFPPWHKGDGLCEYHYYALPEGHRCGWGVIWLTAEGPISPNNWGLFPDTMPIEAVYAELMDAQFSAREENVRKRAAEVVKKHIGEATPDDIFYARQFLQREVRPLLREYIAAGNPPTVVYAEANRPGWPQADYKVKGVRMNRKA